MKYPPGRGCGGAGCSFACVIGSKNFLNSSDIALPYGRNRPFTRHPWRERALPDIRVRQFLEADRTVKKI